MRKREREKEREKEPTNHTTKNAREKTSRKPLVFVFFLNHQTYHSVSMYLMYYLDEQGNRVYTLKVRFADILFLADFSFLCSPCPSQRKPTLPASLPSPPTLLGSPRTIASLPSELLSRKGAAFCPPSCQETLSKDEKGPERKGRTCR